MAEPDIGNKVEAFDWYRMAAEQGNAGAQLLPGVCYENGEGVSRDMAEQGDAQAQCKLACAMRTVME